VAFADDFRFDPDPVLDYQVPADGEYVLEIRDALYRGRDDFVYRLAVGELPFITAIFPIGGRQGTRVPVSLTGWNLPASRITVRADRDLAEVGTRPFATDTLPEVLGRVGVAGDHAQSVSSPVIVNGRINARRPGYSAPARRREASSRRFAPGADR
jgi:hypothetical protein